MRQADNRDRKSAAKSWLAVLVLSLVILGLIRGAIWLWGRDDWSPLTDGRNIWNWYSGWYEWTGRGSWHQFAPLIATAVAILFIASVAAIMLRRRSLDRGCADRRAVALGSWSLYIPALIGSLPAVAGLVESMVTPFFGGGLVSVVAVLLQPFDCTHAVGDWIARGWVGGEGYEQFPRHLIAQPLISVGLATTMVGLIQIFRAWREKRLQTQGLYATIRHPQHLGIAIWTFGLAFAVNGTAAYMSWFTVLYLYVVLAIWEESHLARQFGSAYDGYRWATPFMIPFVNIGLPLPKANARKLAALVAYYIAGMTILCLLMQKIGVQHPEYV